MSVSGPCAWVPTVPAAATAHPSTITSSWASVSWNSEQGSSKSGVDLTVVSAVRGSESELEKVPSVEMQSTVIKAENAFPVQSATESSSMLRYSPEDVHLNNFEVQGSEQGDTLSRLKLEKLNADNQETNKSHLDEEISFNIKSELSDDVLEDEKEHSETNAGSSDDGAGSSVADDKKASQLEKKKMKRFRLTHNQTRFLMSEFTRQAHPDAAHRERLSREIPGLTPRQVQVWFQNRRAKLKRLTSNDRERMLKSRALPDDFDTTQVLRTPFGSKATSEAPGLLTEGLPRLNDDDYVISPLSSASTSGPGFSTTDRGFESYQNRGAAATVPDLRSSRVAFPFPRSSSFSESSFNNTLQYPGRFARPGAETIGHPGVPYPRRPIDYAMNRPTNGIMVGYNHHRPLEGSVSPTGQSEQQMPSYGMDNASPMHSYQSPLSMAGPKPYGGLEMNSHMHSSGRSLSTLQHLPVSDAPGYRPYSYESHPYGMNAGIPFSQANASSLSLPASFPSDTTHIPQAPASSSSDDRMNHASQVMDPLRAKYGQGYEYANYL
ncbi:hypothetical protein BJX64DRAFT_182576 [Aspergillus heterothallicus]